MLDHLVKAHALVGVKNEHLSEKIAQVGECLLVEMVLLFMQLFAQIETLHTFPLDFDILRQATEGLLAKQHEVH